MGCWKQVTITFVVWSSSEERLSCQVCRHVCGLGEGVLHVGTYGTASGNVEFVLAYRHAGHCFSEKDRGSY